MSTVNDAKAEVLKCARAWGHYINLRAKIHKKPPNLTEQALLDAVVELDLAEAKTKKTKKRKPKEPKPDGWFEGWSKVIKNQGKEQRGELEEDDPATKTCQQCRESYLEAASSAETFRRFCSRTCEDQYDKELKGEDDKDSETEEA
jgi:hypothetical protein